MVETIWMNESRVTLIMIGVLNMEKNENIFIDVIITSDMHSQFLNGEFGSNIYRAGQYVSDVRKRNENVILLDSGGSLAGSLAAFYYAVVASYKRHPMIKLMNDMQYDASGISPDEFQFGLPFLTRSIALSRFPWLSANIEYALTREPYFSTPYMIKEYNQVKIAIVGLTSDGLMENEYAEMEPDVSVEKTLVAAKRWIRYIHETEQPDFLIVIYHGGLDKISETRGSRHSKNINEAEKIIKELGVIDLIITAHQHQTIIGKDYETMYVQAGENAKELVHLGINFKKRTTSFEIEDIQSKVIDLTQQEESESLLKLTYYDRKAVDHWAEEIITKQYLGLDVDGLEDVLCQTHPFIQLIHDSMHIAYKNNITCVNVPKNGTKGLNTIIKNKDLYYAYPHPDKPIDITITGQNIKDIIEKCYSHLEFDGDRLSQTIIDETLCTIWQGIDYEVDMQKKPYKRVKLKEIDLNRSYRVTMTDYCYRNYKEELKNAVVHNTSYDLPVSTLMAELLKDENYQMNVKDNFKVYHN